eukprot:1899587-Pyramimonas_sp.AAC.1
MESGEEGENPESMGTYGESCYSCLFLCVCPTAPSLLLRLPIPGPPPAAASVLRFRSHHAHL